MLLLVLGEESFLYEYPAVQNHQLPCRSSVVVGQTSQHPMAVRYVLSVEEDSIRQFDLPHNIL